MTTPTSAPLKPFIDFLKDPNAWWKQVWTTLFGVAQHWWLPVALAAVGIVTTCFAARGEVLRRRSAAMNHGARSITVLVPPSVRPSAGQALMLCHDGAAQGRDLPGAVFDHDHDHDHDHDYVARVLELADVYAAAPPPVADALGGCRSQAGSVPCRADGAGLCCRADRPAVRVGRRRS